MRQHAKNLGRRYVTRATGIRMGLLVLAGALGSVLACVDDDDDGDDGEADIRAACVSYCERGEECDDDLDRRACVEDCQDIVEDCQDDEIDETIADLNDCSSEVCDDFIGCSVGAGTQCLFGL